MSGDAKGKTGPTVEDEPKTGTITFIQSHRPPLEDGLYEITVAQSVQNTNAKAPASATFDETYTNTRRFQIAGERFSVDSTEIDSVFPPNGSQGEYSNVLPHIVFSRQTLPWERSVGDVSRSSWMALMLFDENDPIPVVQQGMVGDLQPAPFPHAQGEVAQPSSLPAGAVSYPNLTLEYGEVMWDACRFIDVPVALFSQVVPGAVDVPWLTHSRTVTSTSSATVAQAAGQTIVETSLVVGNRLPDPDTQCVVHLVSIENMISYLPSGDSYTPAAINLPGGGPAALVRLVSLSSWSYRSVDPQMTFSGLLKALDQNDGQRVFAIRPPVFATPTAAEQYVGNALSLGYAPANHHTRQGSNTVSWYRGPFVPFAVPSTIFVPVPDGTNDTPPIQTADEVVRYDPDTGMMDVSYAAAWQIGRLLALQDTGFSQSLVRWKAQNARKVFEAFELSVLEQQLGATLSLSLRVASGGSGLDMHRVAAELIRTKLKASLAPDAGPPGPSPGSDAAGGAAK